MSQTLLYSGVSAGGLTLTASARFGGGVIERVLP
jgi:hypothetical protein